MFVLAQGCTEAYPACRGDGVLVCTKSASRKEARLSFCWYTIVTRSISAPVEVHKANNLSNPKPGHTTGGSGRGARRSGRAGSRKIGCQQNYMPGEQRSIVLSKASKPRHFNVSREARTSEILCKPTEEPNQRLTSGLSAVYQRGEKRSLFLAADQWNNAFLSL